VGFITPNAVISSLLPSIVSTSGGSTNSAQHVKEELSSKLIYPVGHAKYSHSPYSLSTVPGGQNTSSVVPVLVVKK